jgi:hypothetical protein
MRRIYIPKGESPKSAFKIAPFQFCRKDKNKKQRNTKTRERERERALEKEKENRR